MNSDDYKEVRRALDELGTALFEMAKRNGHDSLTDLNGYPHDFVVSKIQTWLSRRYPNQEIKASMVMDVVSYYKSLVQEKDVEYDKRRNIANVGYFQKGRDYQWERDDLEPGHWEDHTTPPDWMVGD